MNQCVAPSGCGRCEGVRLGDSLHCAEHNAVLKPLYLKYKAVKIDDVVMLDRAELEKFSIEQLLKYSSRVEQVYALRSEYRRLAFVPALWDRGHDKQIELCVRCLIDLREILQEKFTTGIQQIVTEDISDDPAITNDVTNIEPALKELSAKSEKMIKEEEDWGDSEAIKIFNKKRTRVVFGMNVLGSLLRRLYTNIDDDQIRYLTAKLTNYMLNIFYIVMWYRKGGWCKQGGTVMAIKISWNADELDFRANNINIMLDEIIHMSMQNINMLDGIVKVCSDKDGFMSMSRRVKGRVSRGTTADPRGDASRIKIMVEGSCNPMYVTKMGDLFVWGFRE